MIETGKVISGAGGGKSGGSGGGLTESADTLKATSYAQVLDLLCEGEIGGLVDGLKSIYLDDTPIQNPDGSNNFTGVSYVATTGTQTQSVIAGFNQVSSETAVGVEVKVSTGPIAKTITDVNVTSVIITVSIPALTFMDDQGALGGSSVQYAIDVQVDGGGWVTSVTDTVRGKCTSEYQRQYRITLPAGTTRNIRVRRITADSTSSQLTNKTFFRSYTEVIDAKLTYPNSALVAIKVNAAQFNAIPKRGYDVKLLKIRIPSNATVRADGSLSYSGTWDGSFKIAWSCCPAWCFYDLITSTRYGLGNYVSTSQIDKWSLYTISKYCNELVNDGFGGTEPRFSCNILISDRQEAFNVVNQMASIFRGMSYISTGSITAVQDAPKDPTYLFTNANVIDGAFSYQGSSAKTRHTVALVAWNDPADMYRPKIEYVEDTAGIARYGVIMTEISAVGCTSRGQAHRIGRWLLYSERYETEVVGFKTGIEGVLCAPGDIIKIADQYRAGARMGGRITAATANKITVDIAPTGAIAGGTLSVIGLDGLAQSRSISTVAGNDIYVASDFYSVPIAQSVWMVGTTAISEQLFRVLSVTETPEGESEVTALAYNPSKYGYIENDLSLQSRNITSLSPVPETVASVTLSESLYRYQNDVRAKITATWPAALNATEYRVEWRENNGNWVSDTTNSLDYDIMNTTVAKYDVRVVAIGAFGAIASGGAESSISALGKTAPPSNVTGFTATIDPLIGVTLNWTSVPDLDLYQYEIRQGASWAVGTIVTRVQANSYKIGLISGTSQTFWIKAIDTTGNYSSTATSIATTLSAPSAVTVTVQVIDNNVLLRWTESTATLAVDAYEIRKGATWAAGTVVGQVSNATFTALFETTGGTYTYWVSGVDIGGNYGTPASISAQVSQPPDYQLFLNFNSTFSGTKTNVMIGQDGFLYFGPDTTKTVQTHFTSNSWTTPQDQINAGYPYFIEPTANASSYEEVIDYGTTLASTKVTLTETYSVPIGSATVVPTISVSNTSSTGPWTNYAGQSTVYATNFRWIKIRYDVTGAAGDDLVVFSTINLTLDAKQKTDSGMVSAVSTDTGGTVVNFTASFIDVASITLTPQGTTRLTAVYDFVDVPNPTSFKVLLYDSAGNRASGTVSWTARGY